MNPILRYRNHSLAGASLRLALGNPRLLVWTYLASLAVGLRTALPFHARISPVLDHSLAASRIAGRLDVSAYSLLMMHLGKQGTSLYFQAAVGVLSYVLLSNILAAGIYYIFRTGEPARLSLVARAGIDYFWRFFRLLLFTALLAGPPLAALFALRALLLKHLDNLYTGRAFFLFALASFAVVAAIAVAFRLWFDVAEAMAIALGIDGDRRVRRALLPSLRLLKERFASCYLTYLLVGCLSWIGLVACVWLWSAALAPQSVILAWILGQAGVLSLLAGRIWQRGVATAIVAFSEPVLPLVSIVPATYASAPGAGAIVAVEDASNGESAPMPDEEVEHSSPETQPPAGAQEHTPDNVPENAERRVEDDERSLPD